MNKALKAILAAVVTPKDLKEIANAIEEDEKSRKERENMEAEKTKNLEKAKTDYDEAMKNATTDEEKAAAEKAFEEAKKNADISADQDTPDPVAKPTDLPPEPLGGGDISPEPGVPGQATPAGIEPAKDNMEGEKTPEELELLKKAEETKNNEEEDERRRVELAAEEKSNALKEVLSRSWDAFAGDMVSSLGLSKKVSMDATTEKLNSFPKQSAEVQEAWKASYEDASKKKTERYNSLGVLAKAARTKKEEGIKKVAADTALRKERFNALRKVAAERGGSMGTPFVGITTMREKEALGRERYGSGQK